MVGVSFLYGNRGNQWHTKTDSEKVFNEREDITGSQVLILRNRADQVTQPRAFCDSKKQAMEISQHEENHQQQQ